MLTAIPKVAVARDLLSPAAEVANDAAIAPSQVTFERLSEAAQLARDGAHALTGVPAWFIPEGADLEAARSEAFRGAALLDRAAAASIEEGTAELAWERVAASAADAHRALEGSIAILDEVIASERAFEDDPHAHS